jgi:hypothetical protein
MEAGDATQDLVEVSIGRFAALEELEKSLPDLIAKAIINYKNENLRKLHQKDKDNPEAVRNRVKKYISKNRDKINEKRRERRKLLSQTNEVSNQTSLNSISISENSTYEPASEIMVSFND